VAVSPAKLGTGGHYPPAVMVSDIARNLYWGAEARCAEIEVPKTSRGREWEGGRGEGNGEGCPSPPAY